MKLEVRDITVAGILGGVCIVLGMTPLGFIPVPTPAGAATIMHVPVIMGAILEGPLVGSLVGLIFGIFSFLRAGSPFFADPVIAILPRVLIAVLAGYSYKLFSGHSQAVAITAVVGTLTNTLGVLALVVWKEYLPLEAAVGIALSHGIPEVVVAVIITVLIMKVWDKAK
ncbi:ECF transporter S component [Fuchsiella alkaliacetigena]|uniref:ECF transporter S component n=1 Tax=Fuchsiella alkaliacetigena TaxID=957042 RepID=UPI00200B0E7D|nr:ECF transporter S component [Fuchsiella alkaliacetigena]MCK8824129.1 ECF transporter S component [Fuchsiella alkaliacetigena]